MAAKPETTFIASIHKQLAGPYHVKMNNPFTGGVADVWYSGDLGDLWVEYKYLPITPARADVKPDLSMIQRKWLTERHREGRNVAVIVGVKEGGVLLRDEEWLPPMDNETFKSRIISRKDIAEWILSQTGVRTTWPSLLPSQKLPE